MGVPSSPIGDYLYYYAKLPLFAARVSLRRFDSLAAVLRVCPRGRESDHVRQSISRACSSYGFLEGQDPERLCDLYNMVSTVRLSDVYLYPFLNGRSVHRFNSFHNLELVRELYERGPVLIVYAHTGSIYQTGAAMGALGFTVHPIAFVPDLTGSSAAFRRIYGWNLAWSERCHSGGHYLYAKTPSFPHELRRLLRDGRRSLIFSLPDLPQAFVTDKREAVAFLGRQTAFPVGIIELFLRRKLPMVLCLASVELRDGSLKRVVRFERIPDGLSPGEILQLYAAGLDAFIRQRPEQLLMLTNLDGYYV